MTRHGRLKLTSDTYKRAALGGLLGLLLLAASACNTMEGAGEDIQSGGEAIERSAEDTKRSM